MPNSIRRKISRTIQKTFRWSSSIKSRGTSWSSIKRTPDHSFIASQFKQASNVHDYIDLSECYSMDSGVFSMEKNPGESTKLYNDDSSSLLTLSNISPIPYVRVQSNINIQPLSDRCCHCLCHQFFNKQQFIEQTKKYSSILKTNQNTDIQMKIYPLIF